MRSGSFLRTSLIGIKLIAKVLNPWQAGPYYSEAIITSREKYSQLRLCSRNRTILNWRAAEWATNSVCPCWTFVSFIQKGNSISKFKYNTRMLSVCWIHLNADVKIKHNSQILIIFSEWAKCSNFFAWSLQRRKMELVFLHIIAFYTFCIKWIELRSGKNYYL